MICSKVIRILLDQNITSNFIGKTEQKMTVRLRQLCQHWCSKLLGTYPVTNSFLYIMKPGLHI
jgi:hypothetical protein